MASHGHQVELAGKLTKGRGLDEKGIKGLVTEARRQLKTQGLCIYFEYNKFFASVT